MDGSLCLHLDQVAQRPGAGWDGDPLCPGNLQHRPEAQRAFKMTVEFHLGKGVIKIFQVFHWISACVFSVSCRNSAPDLSPLDRMIFGLALSSALACGAASCACTRFGLRSGSAWLIQEDPPDDGRADIAQQVLEHLRSLALIFYQRICLGISLQPDRYAQGFHAGQVIHPQFRDGSKQHLAVDLRLDAMAQFLRRDCRGIFSQPDAFTFTPGASLGLLGLLQMFQHIFFQSPG